MKYKKIIVSVIVIIILLGIKVLTQNQGIKIEETEDNIEEKEIEIKVEDKKTQEKEEINSIKVHVSGEVIRPGIVQIEQESRVADAIEIVGGLTETADLDQINLAQILEDGMKIYVPSVNEDRRENIMNTGVESRTQNKKTGIININTATVDELDTLPGIGKSTANKIISYREEKGKFKSIEEIMEVSGIGDAKFDSIKKLIDVK